MADILIVEDDNTLGMTLEMNLGMSGHQVRWATTLSEAYAFVEDSPPDLIILDLGLPDGDGLELCRAQRAAGRITPILMLTARGTLESRINGLESGADDYVPKPFDLPELLARVEALLRRQQWHRPGDNVQVGQLRIDFRRREAWRNEEEIALTELEFKLLRYLLDHCDEVVSREDLLTRVWDLSPNTRTRTVDVFIGRLRRHIEQNNTAPAHLLNIRGVGYKLTLR
jgi:DNA-binding response OmpR family regulator